MIYHHFFSTTFRSQNVTSLSSFFISVLTTYFESAHQRESFCFFRGIRGACFDSSTGPGQWWSPDAFYALQYAIPSDEGNRQLLTAALPMDALQQLQSARQICNETDHEGLKFHFKLPHLPHRLLRSTELAVLTSHVMERRIGASLAVKVQIPSLEERIAISRRTILDSYGHQHQGSQVLE